MHASVPWNACDGASIQLVRFHVKCLCTTQMINATETVCFSSVVQKISTTHPCHSGDARHTRMCSLSQNRSLAHSVAIGCVFGNRPLARPLQIGHQHGKTLSSEIVQDVTPAMHTLGSTPGERVRAHVLLVLCTSARPLACAMFTLAFTCFRMGIIGSASRDNNQRRQTFGQWLTTLLWLL